MYYINMKQLYKIIKKPENILLFLIFLVFLFLHFYGLSEQEFIGDEASPMLLIDRMWDAVNLRDIRFLAYPFLFYMDPFRSIFSGTLLHILGPDRIILRLPSIIFSVFTFGLLILIFTKEKVDSWLIILSLLSYSLSGLIFHNRYETGGAQTRFFFLLTGYILWQGYHKTSIQKARISLVSWFTGMLTMLDTVALLPGIVVIFWNKQFFCDRKTKHIIIILITLLSLYFLAWLILPYLAYKYGLQDHYINRGLFYYFSRVNEGPSTNPFSAIQALAAYTSWLFTLWLIASCVMSFRIKKLSVLQLLSIPAWIVVIILNRSSSHIIVFVGLFFFQTVIVTNYYIRKFPILKLPIIIVLICIIYANAANLFNNYLFRYKSSTKQIIIMPLNCLDTAVVRMYKDHGSPLPQKACEADN